MGVARDVQAVEPVHAAFVRAPEVVEGGDAFCAGFVEVRVQDVGGCGGGGGAGGVRGGGAAVEVGGGGGAVEGEVGVAGVFVRGNGGVDV